MTGEELLARWVRLAGPDAVDAGRDLLDRYAEPHRHYHDREHLAEVLDHVDRLAGHAADADAVRYAAWFHDAIYDPAGSGNEERSADLAEEVLARLGVPTARVTEVGRLVRVTAAHAAAPGDRNAAVLCDADLAILGSAPARYARYAADVRAEYRDVDDELFRVGRAAVLRGLLDLPELYRTPAARAAFAERARHNVTTELTLLAAGPAGPAG